MPVNYRVDGSVDVTPAIRPIGIDWTPLQNSLENNRRRQEEKQRQAAAEKAAKAKQAADEALYDPGNVTDFEYQKDLTKIGEKVLDFAAEGYKKGTTGSTDHNYNINKMKQEATLVKGKANAALAEGTRARQDIDKLPKYYNKQLLNERVYDYMHPKVDPNDPNSNIDWSSVDAKKIGSVSVNPYDTINPIDMYDEKSKDWAQKVREKEYKFTNYDPNDGTADGLMMRTDGSKAVFFKPVLDDKGKVTKWVPGVTDESANLIMSDPEIRGEAQSQLDRYIEAEVIQRANQGDTRPARLIYDDIKANINEEDWLRSYVKTNLERINKSEPISKTQQIATYSKPSGDGKDEEFKATKMVDQKRVINLRQPGDKDDKISTGDVPEEYRFSGKKLDQPVVVNSTKIYDENTNNAVTGQESIGDKKFYPTRTMLMAYDTKSGKYVHGSTENHKKAPNVVYKWVVGGTMEAEREEVVEDNKPPKIVTYKRNVFMPYEEVSNDIKAKFGFDLNDRDVSEISDLELSSFIKEKYPTSSAQERLQIFKKLRSQK